GDRTRDLELGKLRLYQLSYARSVKVECGFYNTSWLPRVFVEDLHERAGGAREVRRHVDGHRCVGVEIAARRVAPHRHRRSPGALRPDHHVLREAAGVEDVRPLRLGAQVDAGQRDLLVGRIADRDLELHVHRPLVVVRLAHRVQLRQLHLDRRAGRLLRGTGGGEQRTNEKSLHHPAIAGWPVTSSSSASSCTHSAVRNDFSHRAITTVARQLPTTLTAVRAMSMSSSTPRMTITPSTGRLNEASVPRRMTSDARGTPATPFEVSISVSSITICCVNVSCTFAACATKIEARAR